MRSYSDSIDTYKSMSDFEEKDDYKRQVEMKLGIIFAMSQSVPMSDISDFFSGENFSLTECY